MKKIFIPLLAVAALLAVVGCTPKTGGKMADSKPAATATGDPSKAPVIPMPTGNVRASAPKAGTPPTIQIAKAQTFTLENGLKCIVVENHKLPKVAFQIFVDHDPVAEKEAVGYLDMMGELLAKGTTTRPKAKLDEEIDFLGARLSSSSNGINGECLSRHSEKLLALMADVLLNPTFPEEELKKSKTRAQAGLAQSKDNADAIAANVGSVLRNGKHHPFGEVTTEESLEKVNMAQIKMHYGTYFKPNVSYFVVVGDITKDKAEKFAKKFFGSWQRGEVPKHDYPEPKMPEKAQVDFVNKPGAVQSVIHITYPVPLAPGDPDAIRARLMNTILGGYFNSRVNQNLREKHGWTYGARTGLNSSRIIGSFTATASVRNAVTDSSVQQFLYELARIRDLKVPAKELTLAKNVLTGQFSQNLEDPATVAEFALNTARFNLPADYYEKYLTTLNAVGDAEILAMAKKYIRPDRAHILVVGNREEVAEKLKKFSPEEKVNFWDFKGNPVKAAGKIPDGTSAETVIADYLTAIGGAAKIAAIKDVYTVMSIKTGGPELAMKIWQKASGKFAMEMTMNGQVLSKRVFDGAKAKESGMGGATRMLEGADLEDTKEQSLPCKEAKYLTLGYKLTLKGVEELNGKNAFVLEVKRPDGKVSTEYYDMATSLKIREIATQGSGEEQATVTSDFDNYKAVEGVLFPHTLILGGVFPTPLKAMVTEMKANAGMDDSLFLVN